jgi:sugar lactone lactonase YvrE
VTEFAVVDAAGIQLGEHPIWDRRTGRVAWVDIFAGVLRWPSDDGVELWNFPPPLGAAAIRRSGGVVAAADGGIHFRDAQGDVDRDPITGLLPDGVRFNDGACDPEGNFVVGTTSLQGRPGLGSLYRIDPNGAVEVLESAITESNGLSWSHDGRTLYYIDSGEPVIRRYDYHGTAPLKRLSDLYVAGAEDGVPDGLCIDSEGALWVAVWEGGVLWRLSADGELLVTIDVPVSRPTCPAFGDSHLERLFVATAWDGMDDASRDAEPWAGHLLAFKPRVPGAPAHEFAG